MLRVALLTLGDPETLTGGYLYHRRMADLASDHDAQVDFVSFPHRAFPLPALVTGRIWREVRQLCPDVLVLDSLVAAYVAGRRPPVAMVGMLHQGPGGIGQGPIRTAVQASLDRMAYARAGLLLVAGQYLVEQLVRSGVERDRIRLVPPGRDPAVQAEPVAFGPGIHILCVGNWAPWKGILDLLDAFALVGVRGVMLHLVGDPEMDPAYAARVYSRLSQPDLAGRVTVHGRVAPSEMAAFYAGADLFVLPGLRETYGTVYGEAMAAGLPVVGWEAGNLPYLVTPDKEGLMAPVGDIPGLAQALARLCGDVELRRQMGAAAARRAATFPTWDESAALFFSAVREGAKGSIQGTIEM